MEDWHRLNYRPVRFVVDSGRVPMLSRNIIHFILQVITFLL